ncbi:hypothetical protein INS49_007322 [Diaporthe citri]|uniref:uncharacterized protein n=1 Tax=Diaporthe citri TaxID=83186 RepID=UPI001C7F7341|nr:uncharacterized protein INS49_007322 [Diaporthe citri]KAG6365711.1 hypothetical protein INS49_007322 [Diaporthe citri]
MSNSSLASLCSSGNIPKPTLFGAEILSLTSNLVSNYSTYVPDTYNYNHPSVFVDNVDYCNITVTYTHPGQNDKINVEAWLPLEWNERLMAVGGGGLVAGRFVLSYFFMAGAIGQGYATVTDAGTSTDPATGLTELLLEPGNMDWNAVQNFGSRALNDESIIANDLVASFYGRKPQYSYWSGCSQGRRQGLMLAQSCPTAYDGIVAPAPAINIPLFAPSLYWPQLINALTDAAVAYCDAKDGFADGVISDTDGCDFDPFSVVGESFDCSDTGSAMQISHGAALVAIATWAGPFAADGTRLWYGLEKGTFLAGWRGEGWLAYDAVKDPSFDSANLTLDQYSWLMHNSETEWKSLWSTNEPDLSAYRNAGGKIMTYHGLADPNIPPKGIRDYYERAADHHLRPDARAHLVENGTVPETLPISFTDTKNETQNRILCPLPLKTTFNATCGDGARAECFNCAEK